MTDIFNHDEVLEEAFNRDFEGFSHEVKCPMSVKAHELSIRDITSLGIDALKHNCYVVRSIHEENDMRALLLEDPGMHRVFLVRRKGERQYTVFYGAVA
jgi:hypothetical protein